MGIVVRKASLDDVKGIVDVNCSGVVKWYKEVDGKRVEASYEELSVEERWSHGGPWMSIETCSIHLNYLLINNQYPLVAEIDGRIVGELELYIGEEMGVLGKSAFIDILWVHRNYRRKGVGRALINKALQIAIENNCDTLSVWPEEKAIPFYKKVGLNKIAFKIDHVVIDLSSHIIPIGDHQFIFELPEGYDKVKKMYLISPRIESAYTVWIKNQWLYAVEEARMKIEEGQILDLEAVYVIENLWRKRREARLILWTLNLKKINKILKAIFYRAKQLGFNKIQMYIEDEVYRESIINEVNHEIKGKHVVLAKTL